MEIKKMNLLYIRTIILVMILGCFVQKIFSCGGGVVPYIPTQSGSSNTSSKEFFLIEKGVSGNMFDVKKLQPLFRNIVFSGNERKVTPYYAKSEKDSKKETDRPGQNSPMTATDSTHVRMMPVNSMPVLNIHRLH